MMISRKFIVAFVLIVSSISLLGLAYAENRNKQWGPGTVLIEDQSRSLFPQLAKIGFDQALNSAEKKTSGKALGIKLEKEHGGLVYTTKIVTPENSMVEVIVDAGDGRILSVEEHRKHRWFGRHDGRGRAEEDRKRHEKFKKDHD